MTASKKQRSVEEIVADIEVCLRRLVELATKKEPA